MHSHINKLFRFILVIVKRTSDQQYNISFHIVLVKYTSDSEKDQARLRGESLATLLPCDMATTGVPRS